MDGSFGDPQDWVKTVEDKVTEKAVAGYDYTQSGSNDLTDPSMSLDYTKNTDTGVQDYGFADAASPTAGYDTGI